MSTEIIKSLNSDEVAFAITKAQQLQSIKEISGSTDTFTFLANFDGTNNDKDSPSYSNDKYPTAVGEIAELGKAAQQTAENFKSRYYPGVGTSGTEPGSSVFPAVEAIATAELAYKEFQSEASSWLKTHPDGEVTTMLTSFSRGAAPAAIFSQLLYERGLIDPENPDVPLIESGKIEVSAGLVISPVTTGTLDLNIAFAPNVSNMATVLAENEYRENYIQNVYEQPGFTDVWLSGNHCDIGASYDNGLGAIYLQKYTEFFRNAGLPIGEVGAERQFNPDEAAIHVETVNIDSLWNYAYGSLEEDSSVRIKVAGNPATFTDNEVNFTLYNGREISLLASDLPWFVDNKTEFDAWQNADRELEEDANKMQQEQIATTEQYQQEVDQAAQLRATELGGMQSLNNLADAIDAEDGVGAVKAGLDSYANFAAYQVALHPNADNSTLESNQAATTALSSAIGFGQAIDSGNGLALMEFDEMAGFDSGKALQGAGSALGLAMNIANSECFACTGWM